MSKTAKKFVKVCLHSVEESPFNLTNFFTILFKTCWDTLGKLTEILEMMIVLKGYDDDHQEELLWRSTSCDANGIALFHRFSLLTLQLRFRSHFGLPTPKWT